MAEVIQDRHVVAVLRPFVRATTPMLDALCRIGSGPARDPEATAAAGRLRRGFDAIRFPGTATWSRMTLDGRVDWWVNRLGRFTVLVAALPGLAGALADRVPVQDTLALAGQGLLLCAIAGEHGVNDPADKVRLLAAVLFDRDIEPAAAARPAGDPDTQGAESTSARKAAEDRATAELTEELTESSAKHGRITVKAATRTLWRFGRTLWSLGDELDKRPQGRFYHKMLGMLPVVGLAGDYLGERSALKRAASAGRKWLAANT